MTLFGLGINLYLTGLWILGYRPIGNRPLLFLGILLFIVGVQFIFFGLLAEFLLNLHLRTNDHYLDEVVRSPSSIKDSQHDGVAARPAEISPR
jgi:hypothetical protein